MHSIQKFLLSIVLLTLVNQIVSFESIKLDNNLIKKNIDRKQIFRTTSNNRRKRSYYPWNGQVAPVHYDSFTRWKPPTYQLSRPYYIPVFGAPGRIPIYYPPQPILLNPGTPQDNPLFPRKDINNQSNNGGDKDFKGPPYLPPKTDERLPNITDKFGMADDLPVWGGNSVERPTTTSRPSSNIPTRLPRPPPTLPPLIHNKDTTNQLSLDSDTAQPAFSRPSTSSPPPPKESSGPSNCVWAIVNCCSVSGPRVVESCFEQRGCPGPFWGRSPCDSDFARAALASALNYYNSK